MKFLPVRMRHFAVIVAWAAVVAPAAAGAAQGKVSPEQAQQDAPRRQARSEQESEARPGILGRLLDDVSQVTGGRLRAHVNWAADHPRPAGRRGRFRAHVNWAYQASSTQSEIPAAFRAYGEEARFLTRQEFRGGAHVDAGGALRVWRALAVGASYTQMTNAGAAVVNGTVPHPLETGNDRTVPEQALALVHRQRATHAYVAWRVSMRDTFEVDFSAGPTYFNLRQGVVANLILVETSGPPFPEVGLQVETGEHTRNGVGYNAGVDVTFMVTPATRIPRVGIGWFARVTGGSVALPLDAASRRRISVGGFQTGVGLRLLF